MPRITLHPVTRDRWRDLEKLFGPRGACAGCWCMYWRLPRTQWARGKGEGNRKAMRRLVGRGELPGVLAYSGEEPVGWCAVAPRDAYPALERSRILKRVDEEAVWSVSCFFIARAHRRRGLTVRLLNAAVRLAAAGGARIVEGYPIEAKRGPVPDAFAWTGLTSAFLEAGFTEVARRSPARPIMRRTVRGRARTLPV